MKHTKHHFARGSASGLSHILPFVVCFILLQSVSFSVHAQGNWLWANYWTGNDDPLSSTNAYNYVVKTAFDEDGNIYAFGACGGTAQIAAQNQNVHMLNIPIVLTANTMGSVLAKYDRNGNLLWHRLIKSTGAGNDCRPYDMFLKDNKIYIAGDYTFEYLQPLWFFDTLIDHQSAMSHPGHSHPPYSYGNYSYFVTFDLNGNRLESHFVYTLSRQSYTSAGIRVDLPLCMGFYGANPLSIDSQGNCYLAISFQYSGQDTLPFTIIIDADPQKTYDVFLPGNCDENNAINNIMLYKFTPNWELDWAKLLIDHTEGLSPYIPRDTINPYFVPCVGGMSIDGEDNLYISGYLFEMEIMDEYNQYPMRIYWDSSHYATVIDKGMAISMPFITKYNSNGEVMWSNQAYVKNETNTDFYFSTNWSDNFVDNRSVYLLGNSSNAPNYNPLFYFDNETYHLPQYNIYHHTSYFVRFNKENGSYENFGINPSLHTSYTKKAKPAVINNHLLSLVVSDFNIRTLLSYYNINGTYMYADTISYPFDIMQQPGKTIVSNDGYILCEMVNGQNITFGNDFTLDLLGDTRSHAIIALKYDPSILEPYPEGPVEVAQYDERLDRIRLYPNPAVDRITIESPENLPIDGVAITNLAGQFLGVRIVDATHANINVRDLPAGTYIAHINTRMGNTERKFVVKR